MRKTSVLIVALALVIGSRVDAGTILFSNLGPGGGYSGVGGWFVGDAGHIYDIATSFVPSKNGDLDFLELGISFDQGTNALTVRLMTDDGGLPGAVIESLDVFDLPAFGSSSTLLTTATSALNPPLLGGARYWVEASAAEPHSQFAWNQNITGDLDIAGRIDGGAWVLNGTPGGLPPLAGAIRVNAVPEPASVVLLTLSVAGVGRRRRRRQSA